MVRAKLIDNDAGRAEHTASSAPPSPPLTEHAMVTLAVSQSLDDGRRLPRGARGAIVFVLGEGAAYMVEFVAPFHALATVPAAELSGDAPP